MAIKKPRTTKKRTHAAASGCGSSVSTVVEEMPPHPVQPAPPPLPPGVYFSPSREECLGFLNRRIAGDTELADARGYIYDANVYAESPEALRRRHPPASIRGRAEHAWWFLSETRFQSSAAGGGASKRADRRVESGGYWRLEQSKEELKNQSKKETKQSKKEEEEQQEDEEMGEEEADGVKNSFGFYVGSERKHKTPWLMQEFTSANDDGAGKRGVHALYRVYVSPRASDKKLRDVFGEDAVKKGPDGKKRPARAMVPQQYFDGVADLLPEGSVRLRVQQAPPPQVATSEGLLEYHGHGQEGQYLVPYQQQQQYLGQFQQQEGPYQQEQQQYLDQFQQQEGQDLVPYQQQQQYLGQFEEQDLGPYQQEQQQYLGQFQQQDLGPYQQEQQQYLGQFQQQNLGPYQQEQQQYLGQFEGEDLGPYQQQQGPFAPPEPRPATPDLSGGEFEADDNLSMPMDEFLQMVDEQPAEMDGEQPAETLEGEEPNWGSLGSIVEDDELADFNEEG